MNSIRISIVQINIVWENKQENLRMLHERLKALSGTTEIVVLPEMFSTGFSMNVASLAETTSEETISILKKWSAEYKLAITGSFIAIDNQQYFNRGFFLTPDGEEYYYDKRHLFRMGDEGAHFSSGSKQITIPYLGWNIRLLICYDLRFPVWSRNINNEYDLLIYVANWPDARRMVWDTLLKARAFENQCFVCGVNRVGRDGYNLNYNGGSIVYSAKGEVLASVADGLSDTATATIDLTELRKFRDKFPVWKDADSFRIEA